MKDDNSLLYECWYFAGLQSDVKKGQVKSIEIAGRPIALGRKLEGEYFALGDVCPHRAALLSEGRLIDDNLECPYHGWRFSTDNGQCQFIPSLCEHQDIAVDRIGVHHYPLKQIGPILWVYLAKNPKDKTPPAMDPPDLPFIGEHITKSRLDDRLELACHVDHAVIGLMDPAHGPFVHQQWWWRSQKSIHEKKKHFEPRRHGFAMLAHRPSKNSFAYKILGGRPETEIRFQLPGIRTEHIRIGTKSVLSLTAVTPINDRRTEIRQMFFSDKTRFNLLAPFLSPFARAFLRQDSDMVDVQQKGLSFNPRLMLIDDADQQAKWYYQLKTAWQKTGPDQPFNNPVTAKTLYWRS